jgi:hypothetical protein
MKLAHFFLILLLTLLAGCSTPIGVKRYRGAVSVNDVFAVRTKGWR